MKFSALFLVGLVGLASAQNLRTVFAKQQAAIQAAVASTTSSSSAAAATTTVINTSVVVQGVKAELATASDPAVITQAVVDAYRQIFKITEDDMLGTCGGWGCGPWHPHHTETLGFFNFNWFWYMFSWDCDMCPNDDDTYALTEAANNDDRTVFALASFQVAADSNMLDVDDWALHRKWERAVCRNLRKSGSEALQDARGCAVSFYDLSPTQQVCQDDQDNDHARQEILVKIEGVVLEEDDADKIEAAAAAAGLEDFALEMISSTATDDSHSEAALVLASFAPGGDGCRRHGGLSATDAAAALCSKLKALGLDAAHDCELAQFGNRAFFADAAAHPKTTTTTEDDEEQVL